MIRFIIKKPVNGGFKMFSDSYDFEKLETLSKLKLTENEKEILEKDLEKIILYMDIIKDVPTQEIEPLSHVIEAVNGMRDDEEKPSLKREEVLKNAAKSSDGCFVVPKTF